MNNYKARLFYKIKDKDKKLKNQIYKKKVN